MQVDGVSYVTLVRQQGIGRGLMRVVGQWAMDQAITTIELHVYTFNRSAVYLYEELGYVAFSQRMTKYLSHER